METTIRRQNSRKLLGEDTLQPGASMVIKTRDKVLGDTALLIHRSADEERTTVHRITEDRHVRVADRYEDTPPQSDGTIAGDNQANQREAEFETLREIVRPIGELTLAGSSLTISTATRDEGYLLTLSLEHH